MIQPGGGYPSGNDNGNGSGFRYGRGQGQTYPRPVPPEQQMTLQEREAVLMAAGRLAAEYLVTRGDLPPNVLENRPPSPIPFGSQYQYHQQRPPVPSPMLHFQGRPLAPHQQHRQAQQWLYPFHFQVQQQRPPAVPQRRFPGPRPFQGGRGPFPKRPRQPRSSPYGPPGPARPPQTRNAGQATATPVVAACKNKEDDHGDAPGGEAVGSQPTAQTDVPASGSQQTDEPSSSSLGAKASESS